MISKFIRGRQEPILEALTKFISDHHYYDKVVNAYKKAGLELPINMSVPRTSHIHLRRLGRSGFFMFVHKKGRLNNYVVIDIENEEIYLESRGKSNDVAMKAYFKKFATSFIEQILDTYLVSKDKDKPYYKIIKHKEGKEDIIFYNVPMDSINIGTSILTYDLPDKSTKKHYAYTIYSNTIRIYLVYIGGMANIIKIGQKDLNKEEYDNILQHSESAIENNEYDASIFSGRGY